MDLERPLSIRAEMARRGLCAHQLRPWESPDVGYRDPLSNGETRDAVRRFMAELWDACVCAERNGRMKEDDNG